MVSRFTYRRLAELPSLRFASAVSALHARAQRGLLAVPPRLYVPVTRKVSAKNGKREPISSTGAASSGFFVYRKLYRLLQTNTGAGLGLFCMGFPSVCLAENLPKTIPPLPSGLGFGVFLVASLLLAGLWKNPRGGRKPRQRREGIFHRLLAKLWRSVVLAAAWWHQEIVCGAISAVYDRTWHFVDRFAPGCGQKFAGLLELRVLPFLLLDWIAWPVARDYLQAKWKLELDEDNKKYAAFRRDYPHLRSLPDWHKHYRDYAADQNNFSSAKRISVSGFEGGEK